MRRVVEAAIAAAKPDGLTRCYFRLNKWEGELRELFLGLPKELAVGHLPDTEAVVEKMRRLSNLYRTSRTKPLFHLILDAVREEVSRRDWAAAPPKLLGSTEDDLKQIAGVVHRVMDYVRTRKPEREKDNYSYSTKFLHYLYPETFAIFDSQVWSSIKAAERVTKPHMTRRRAADWYFNVLAFYRDLWEAAVEAGLAQAMSEAVQSLVAAMRRWSGNVRACITTLDAIDKFLYLSNGDPRELGLAD
jgi:hypothetical protein